MFDREIQIIPELIVELADSVVESANSTADFTADPVKIGLWVRGFKPLKLHCSIVVCASGVGTASVDVISDVFVVSSIVVVPLVCGVVLSVAVVPLVCAVAVVTVEQNYRQIYSNQKLTNSKMAHWHKNCHTPPVAPPGSKSVQSHHRTWPQWKAAVILTLRRQLQKEEQVITVLQQVAATVGETTLIFPSSASLKTKKGKSFFMCILEVDRLV